MTKRMLIDSTHAEETRVVVLDGNRLEDFDVETAAKKQLKGNIYLAKVVRVEPSLQAAFVEYGGGRHGFLAFGEIHPDYYQIPVADRQRLLEMQEAEARAEEEAEDAAAAAAEAEERHDGAQGDVDEPRSPDAPNSMDMERPDTEPSDTDMAAEPAASFDEPAEGPASLAMAVDQDFLAARDEASPELPFVADPGVDISPESTEPALHDMAALPSEPTEAEAIPEPAIAEAAELPAPDQVEPEASAPEQPASECPALTASGETADPEPSADGTLAHVGSEAGPLAPAPAMLDAPSHDGADDNGQDDDVEEAGNSDRRESRPPARYMRSYKIQEVIRRRQILLVQVVKEERGTKGAALTTFISLAGRFSVLMPNSPRGGGISRKITSASDRRRLKEVTAELQIPRGMGLIVRTAGAARPKAEIKRDCEYLLELWDSIRETTMASIAPALIHEEASLIKRSIRDNYSRDVEEVLVDGEVGWRAARDFMRMLMPAHARKVIMWNEPQPLFAKHNVEAQLDGMLEPTVQLRSGGYLVINQTEALVAIDVNSGRSTRERGIEETALKTNLEAADEVARQLRLRDLAGLIVIDFIDMESRRNNAAVEKRMKDALRDDRARIQLGSISHFGLMELSRQRLRPSLAETSFTTCPHCGGTGHVRTTETAALAVLRAVEEEGAKRRAAEIVVHVAGAVALYVLNHKRQRLAEIEARYGMEVTFAADESLLPPQTRIERVRAQSADMPYVPPPMPALAATPEEDDLIEEEADTEEDEAEEVETVDEAPGLAADPGAVPGETAEEADNRRRKRRRRRRGGRREETPSAPGVDPASLDQPDISPILVSPDLVSPAAANPVMADTVEPGSADAEPALVAEGAPEEATTSEAGAPEAAASESGGEDDGRGRRRGRRGGRRRRREPGDGDAAVAESGSEELSSFDAPAPAPAYTYNGPTPADPFGGQVFDIFDIMDEPDMPPAPAPVVERVPAPEIVVAEAAPAPVAEEPVTVVHAEPVADHHFEPEPVHHFEAGALPPAEPEPVHIAEAPPAVIEEEPPLANGHAAEPIAAPDPEPAAFNTAVPPPVLVGSVPAAEKKRGWWRR